MKIKITIVALFSIMLFANCVQKTNRKTVVFRLNTTNMGIISKVEIKGKDTPFSWNHATKMKTIKKDNLYELTTTFKTGYTSTEVKFVVNDSLEFASEESRRINFATKDTTYYQAKFNKR